MGGKYEKNRKSKSSHRKQRRKWGRVILLLAVVAVAVAALFFAMSRKPEEMTENPAETTQTVPAQSEAKAETEMPRPTRILNRTLEIGQIGKYTGMYMEDGTDEVVADVLKLVVTNVGSAPIQYAEIQLQAGSETACFSVSTLPEGESAVLLEKNRIPYNPDVDYMAAAMEAHNIATHKEPLNLQADKLKIQILDGAINVTNISGEDIEQDIVIYYKNIASDMYYGGITYRIKLEGGLKADELRQIMASHFHGEGSAIMNITIG